MYPITNTDKIPPLLRHLLNDGLIDSQTADAVMQAMSVSGLPVVSLLVSKKILSSQQILQSCATRYGLKIYPLSLNHIHYLNELCLNSELMRLHHAIPVEKHDHTLQIGISDPSNQTALEVFAFHTGCRVQPVLVAEDILTELITLYANTDKVNKQLQVTLQNEYYSIEPPPLTSKEIDEEPIIKFTHTLLCDAAQNNASDIHLEALESYYQIRYRQDGILNKIAEIPNHLAPRIVARLKIMANLDIAERRLPQDGRFRITLPNQSSLDIRISSCPTYFGEKIALRLLAPNTAPPALDELGLTKEQMRLLSNALSMPQGFILVTGPTGSGKTATLYGALGHLNQADKNISTVEDPIEIQLPGINQANIHTKIGLTFSAILRSLLRQDPDILMIGEIRDMETAEIAVHAAQTGHLVLSTLHTNNAIETITRLLSMGIPAYQLHTLTLVIAQRLVRKLCAYCKQPDEHHHHYFDQKQIIFRPQGCQQCRSGYLGRTGIFELLPISPSILALAMRNPKQADLLAMAKQEGFYTLWESGLKLVSRGMTSISELQRIMNHVHN